MKVKKYDNQRSDDNTVLVPNPAFVLPIIGCIASGKTTLLTNLLTSKEFYKQKFSRVLFISCTADLDEKVRNILECPDILVSNQKLQDAMDEDNMQLDENHVRTILPKYKGIESEDIHPNYHPDILTQLVEEQKFTIKTYGKEISDKVLVVIDDAITAGCYRAGFRDVFARFATSLRHVNCSLIHCSQQWKAVPKVIRTQSTGIIICGLVNEIELHDLWENFSCGYNFHSWSERIMIILNKVYQPVVINLQNKRGYKIQRGFEEFVG